MIKHFPESKQFDGKFRNERLLATLSEDIKKYDSVLYVGAKVSRMDHLSLFLNYPGINKNYDVGLLEVWPRNVQGLRNALKKKNPKKPIIKKLQQAPSVEVIEGNVIDFKLNRKYDIGFWWHGPEHVTKEDLGRAIKNLENHVNHIVVMGCPWGEYAEHEWKNPYESHVSHNQPEFFESLGYYAEVQGREGPGSNLMSIKKLQKNDK